MSFNDFVKIINVAKKFGLRGISITGGEPFMNKDLEKMVRFAIKNRLKKIDICSNGILIKQNINLLKMSKVISLAIGLDTCQKDKISKQSDRGMPFSLIEENLFFMRDSNIKFSINTVYTHSNKEETLKIIEYCVSNKFPLRVIELDTTHRIINCKQSGFFGKFIEDTVVKFSLEKAAVYPVNDVYCIHPNGQELYFYNAKCHERKCSECARWTLRINSLGEAIPCYARKDRYPILIEDEKQAYINFLKSVYNLGISPERKRIEW